MSQPLSGPQALLSEDEIRRRYKRLDVRHGEVQPETRKSSEDLLLFDPEEARNAPHYPTPFDSLNEAMVSAGGRRGFPTEGVVVVGGQIGHGKTAVAQNLIECEFRPAGASVALGNFDQGTDQARRRAHGIRAGVPLAALTPGEDYSPRLAQKAIDAYHREGMGAFYINKKRFSSLEAVRQMVHVYAEQFNVGVYVFDTLQKFPPPRPGANEFETVKAAAHLMRDVADNLGVLCIGISQYGTEGSRQTESADMFAMRGGNIIAENADIVLYLDSAKHWRSTDGSSGHHLMVVEKNRFGPPVQFIIDWDWDLLRCEENSWASSWDAMWEKIETLNDARAADEGGVPDPEAVNSHLDSKDRERRGRRSQIVING